MLIKRVLPICDVRMGGQQNIGGTLFNFSGVSNVVFALGRNGPAGVQLLGTAFALDKLGMFATASHVAGTEGQGLVLAFKHLSELHDYQDTGDTSLQVFPVEITALDPFHDLAVLKATDVQIQSNISIGGADDVPVGSAVVSFGYQIAATERMLWKIASSHQAKSWSTPDSGGYVWHTTGSGKTLTSFKAARLATELDFIDKVFFVVDRKDLDYQTMKEYQRFSPDSVNGSESTAGLLRNLDKDDNKIIVTTIQKLNNLMRSAADLPIYGKQVVFIFDECHRSQFGEAQKNLKKKFKKFYQFGFTGTPIFVQNALGADTTASVFGRELHSYVITDAIRDEKVLKFKVDYNDVRPQFKAIESEQDEHKLSAAENKQALLHPNRIEEIAQYILANFRRKTHRLQPGNKGFNAMFAVSSVDAAKLYVESFKDLQKDSDKPLRVATIFSFAANEAQDAIGDIADEGMEVSALTGLARRGYVEVVADLEQRFPEPANIQTEADKKAFTKLFGEYLRLENVLQNFDEFASLRDAQSLDLRDTAAVEVFKAQHGLSDAEFAAMQSVQIPTERALQDYRSSYNDIRDWLRREREGKQTEEGSVDWDDVVFEVDLLKSQEINLDYILELIFENNKKVKTKADLVEEVRRAIRASLGNRAKESLLVDFIHQTDLAQFDDKASVIEAFFTFAQAEQQREVQALIAEENLNPEAAKRYISSSLKREYASDNGTELNGLLPKMSPLNPQYLTKKQTVFQKIAAFVEKFKGVGGQV